MLKTWGELSVPSTKICVYGVRKEENIFTTIYISFHHYSGLRKFSDLPWAELSLGFEEVGLSEKAQTGPNCQGSKVLECVPQMRLTCEVGERMRQGMKSTCESLGRGLAPLNGWGSRRRSGRWHQWDFPKQWEARTRSFRQCLQKGVSSEDAKLNIKPIQWHWFQTSNSQPLANEQY